MVLKQWFRKKVKSKQGNGLFVSLEELLDMRNYTAYMRNGVRDKTLSCQSGDIKSAFKGRGIEFEEIREYIFGDDVRDIDWRVTARKEHPYTKIYTEEKDYEIYVWLDLSASMLFGSKNELKSVLAAKITALLGWLALENKDRFGCVVFDGAESFWFKPQNSRAQLLAILKKIAMISERILKNPHQNLQDRAKSLKILEQNVRNKAAVFMVSDFGGMEDNIKKQLAALARRSKLFLLNVYDILEEKPPKAGEYMAEYEGKRLIFDTVSKDYKHNYFTYFAEKKMLLKEFCQKFGCHLLEFRTDRDIITNLKLL